MEERNRKKRRRMAAFSAAVLVMSMAFSACSLLPEEETFIDAPTVREYEGANYKTEVCKIDDVVLSERLSVMYVPRQSKALTFSIAGMSYGEFFVQTGDEVKKGDVLAELDMGDLKTQIENAQSQIENLELSLKQSEERRTAALKKSDVRTEGLSEEDRESAREAVNKQYDAAAQQLNDRLYILNLRISDLQEKMDERRITAPFDGAVSYIYEPKPGETTSKDRVVIRMSDMSLSVFRGETANWNLLTQDQEYVITVNGEDYTARAVTEKELNIPETSHVEGKRAYVYFVLDEKNLSFVDNTAGRLMIVLDHRDGVLCVPNAAVTQINGHAAVYYLLDSGIRAYREIETGLTGNTTTEVLSGVKEGEEVIVK